MTYSVERYISMYWYCVSLCTLYMNSHGHVIEILTVFGDGIICGGGFVASSFDVPEPLQVLLVGRNMW